MRNGLAIIIGIIIIILAVGGYGFVEHSEKNTSPSPTTTMAVSPSINTSGYCTQKDLEANLMIQGAAGSIYGTFRLKNISSQPCTILGNEFITVNFHRPATNVSVTHTGTTQASPFHLAAGQTLYSQMRYPNGPQCSGATKITPIIFTYKVSATDTIAFTNEQGTKTISIPTCQKQSEATTIQVWNISQHPITP